MNKRLKYYYIGVAILVVIIYFVLSYLLLQPRKESTNTPLAVPTASKVQTKSSSPLNKIQADAQRGNPLTAQEKTLRLQLINQADSFGMVHNDKDFSIVYLKSYDIFQIRIQSLDLAVAQKNSFAWLKTYGFSTNGICKLPVLLYANERLIPADKLSPIPTECQQ